MDQQIFKIEQFAQITDCLVSFLLAAHGGKPMVDLAPRRRSAEPHCLLRENARLGQGIQAPRSGQIFDHEWRIDSKIVHEAVIHLAAVLHHDDEAYDPLISIVPRRQ